MKQILVIGSTVVDVTIRLDRLPKTSEDVHVLKQSMSLGGCAYNISDTIRKFGAPYILFSPVGTGAYGQYVEKALAERGLKSPLPKPDQENGCCYCFIEDGGERTFICYHGAEYLFYPEWFDRIDADTIDSVYICGLEIEETTGPNIVDYLEKHPEFRIFFAPGPRILKISEELLERLFKLHPIIHLNDTEVMQYTGEATIEDAARKLFGRTGNTVIVTLGENGAYYEAGTERGHIAGVKAHQIDTNGAGDSHVGAVMARMYQGYSVKDAIADANRVAAAVVETSGTLLSDEAFARLGLSDVGER